MEAKELEVYIKQKLDYLEKNRDMDEVNYKGKLSFGVEAAKYNHLPAWNDLLQQKKKLQRWIWIDAFLLSVTVVVMTKDVFSLFIASWWKTLLGLVLTSGAIMLFFVIGAYYTLFAKFRQTEREVRKLIYQDILFQLSKTKKDAA